MDDNGSDSDNQTHQQECGECSRENASLISDFHIHLPVRIPVLPYRLFLWRMFFGFPEGVTVRLPESHFFLQRGGGQADIAEGVR